MYNGIGLTTPRGSGTNGYVIRNLSTLRSFETSHDRASAWDSRPPKHREPDEGILEHERKHKVEVKCFELRVELEDKGIDEEEIDAQVDALRAKLLENLAALAPTAKNLKLSDTHGLAAAKKTELSKMARAFGTRSDYMEGDAFDREKQEENKMRRQAEREERDRKKDEERAKIMEQKAKWEAEKRERDRLRRREEDRIRREREETTLKRKETMPPPPVPAARDRDGGRNRPRHYREPYRGGDRRSRSRSPPRRREPLARDVDRRRPPSPISRSPISRSPISRSPSPPPRLRRRFDSRSPSRSMSRSYSPPSARNRQRSDSPPSRRERSPPPTPPRRARERMSPPPPRRGHSRSPSPPYHSADHRMPPSRDGARGGGDVRGRQERGTKSLSPPARGARRRSVSTGSSMSVSTRSGRSRSRSLSND